MLTLVERLFSNDPEVQKTAFAQAIGHIQKGEWESHIGGDCNLFHFVAFAPKDTLNHFLPDWKERLQTAIEQFPGSFDKINAASPHPIIPGRIEGGNGVPALNRDTPLGIALFTGNKEAAWIFLENDANVSHKNAAEVKILDLAAILGDMELVGAVLNQIGNQAVVDNLQHRSHQGQTAEDQARQHGNHEIADTLGKILTRLDRTTRMQAGRGM